MDSSLMIGKRSGSWTDQAATWTATFERLIQARLFWLEAAHVQRSKSVTPAYCREKEYGQELLLARHSMRMQPAPVTAPHGHEM
jgi:hypothetical protein